MQFLVPSVHVQMLNKKKTRRKIAQKGEKEIERKKRTKHKLKFDNDRNETAGSTQLPPFIHEFSFFLCCFHRKEHKFDFFQKNINFRI